MKALFKPLFAIVLLGALAAPASGVIGALDQVPAATLLLPYFELDDDSNRMQTRFTLNNADKAPVLAKVVLWSDFGVPTFNFDLYLGGYDSVEVDLRLLFEGLLPQTGGDFRTIPGEFSDPSVDFPSCPLGASDLNPGHPAPDRLSQDQVRHLSSVHRGFRSVFNGMCYGADTLDGIARGYVTIDVVNQCSDATPQTPGYFQAGGTGIAGNRNVLFGSYHVADRTNNIQTSSPLIAIEADGSHPLTTDPGKHSFYGSVASATGIDNREPLGTVWNARVNQGFPFDDGGLIIWRDTGFAAQPHSCGVPPATILREFRNVVSFDDSETAVDLAGTPFLFFGSAQKRSFDSLSFFDFGFLHLNLNMSFEGQTAFDSPGLLQSWIGVYYHAAGQFGSTFPATRVFGPQHQPDGPDSCSGPNCALMSPVIE